MIFVDLTFGEFLGFFLAYGCLAYVIVVVFGGVINLFGSFFEDKLSRVFHYHYHYKDRRK